MNWKQTISEGQELVLATASKKGKPHAIVAISEWLVDGKLLIAACQMKKH